MLGLLGYGYLFDFLFFCRCNGYVDFENIKVERNIFRFVDTDFLFSMDELDIEYVNNINEWLSLRV